MDFYQVLEKRRTIRDFSDREVPDEVLGRILAAAFKAPTNDHLRQLEFVVVRGQENISRMISPVAENTENIQQAGLEAAAGVMGQGRARHVYRRTAQAAKDAHAERMPRPAVLPAKGLSAMRTGRPKFAQLFCFGMGGSREHPAGGNGGGAGLCVPYPHR